MQLIGIIGSRTKTPEQWDKVRDLVRGKVQALISEFGRTGFVIVSGGAASGADYFAKTEAKANRLKYLEAVAFWNIAGSVDRSAGFFRNQTIVDVCDVIYAFWDGESSGTKDTIKKAIAAGVKVITVPTC
jgi:hypothetical protein